MLLIIIVISCNCKTDVIVKCVINRFLKYFLSIKRMLSSALSAVCFDVYESNIEVFELTIYENIIISIEVVIVLNVNNEVRFNLSFVIRFNVRDSAIVDNFLKLSFEDNIILKDKALITFVIDNLTFIINLVFNLLFLMAFFSLKFSYRLRCIILLSD